jgi:NarL family two-component system response regulator LiaR
MTPIRILVVDDHIRVHESITLAIKAFDDLEIVGHGSNGHEAIQLCGELFPDIIIMDVIMPGMNGLEATKIIHETHPGIRILALSSFQDIEAARGMMEAGASGYLLKNSSIDDLAQTIRTVFAGKSVMSPEITAALLQPAAALPTKNYGLTPREKEILALMVAGLNNGEIAERLTISLATAKFHVSGVLTKLNVSSRVEAVALALSQRLVNMP